MQPPIVGLIFRFFFDGMTVIIALASQTFIAEHHLWNGPRFGHQRSIALRIRDLVTCQNLATCQNKSHRQPSADRSTELRSAEPLVNFAQAVASQVDLA